MPDTPEREEPGPKVAGDGPAPGQPEYAKAMRDAIASMPSVQQLLADLRSPVASAFQIPTQLQNLATVTTVLSTDALRALRPPANFTQLPDYQRILTNLAPRISFPDFAELFRRHQPANWHGTTGDGVKTMDLIELARAGWPSAWVPGPKVLRALALAAPAERGQVLCDHEKHVLDDCDAVLAEVVSGPSEVQAGLLRQAVAAARQGYHAPAQAMAASVIDTVIRESVSPWRGYNDWLRLHPDDDDFTIGQMRYMTTMAPVRPALERFFPEKGDPVPEAFNRHASTHAVGDVQYTRTNALVGVLLAVSIVREFHAEYAEQVEDGSPEVKGARGA
ncbi:hypothetical protein AB0B88_10660 [Micromonospora haikouensis]|uniref:hypothetical protein n=1 Tax=Micromonospora haikouensis TaxID=686309 RepID=UPI0033DB241A